MSQSLSQIYLLVVFSTKTRQRFLAESGLRDEMHAYLAGTCRNQDSPSLRVGGTDDHVHVLCRLARTLSVANLVKELKRESSKWIKTKSSSLGNFHWQDGYGAFSVCPSHVEPLMRYIERQEEHHAKESFQDEFRRLLGKYGIDYDEQYVWD